MQGKKLKGWVVTAIAAVALSGCAAMTPTQETEERYAIYDINPSEGVTASHIGASVRKALQKNMSGVKINSSIPPYPLPEQPGRFQLVEPFKNSNLGVLAAASGTMMKVPTCENSVLTATGVDSSMGNYGEQTSFFLCLLPYQKGYHINMYTTFTKASGGFSVETLGATMARTVVGDSSQFIDRTINSIVNEIETTGSEVVLLESYP